MGGIVSEPRSRYADPPPGRSARVCLNIFPSGAFFFSETMSYSVDKLIEEWLAENKCEDLPGTGKPLNLDEYFSWPEDVRLGYSLLKNSGFLPEEVEQLREIKRLEEESRTCPEIHRRTRLERQLREEEVKLSLRLEQSRRRRKP
jgi:hypothetical protein